MTETAENASIPQSAAEQLLTATDQQSLDEERETSTKELQTTNEELITAKRQLFDRNDQVDQANIYAEAIFTTIREPLLILNGDFKIISANKSFYKEFVIREEESIGKILFDLQNNGWNIPELRNKLLKIQKGNEKFLEWEITYGFPTAGLRSICFNAQPFQKENGEHWILLAFQDLTVRKEKEKIEKNKLDDQRKLMENIPQITATASPDGSATFFNNFFLNYSGMTLAEAINQGWEAIIKPEAWEEYKKLWNHSLETGEDFEMEVQLKRKTDDMYRWHLRRSSAIRNEEGIIMSWVGAASDIHDQKTKEESKDEFMSIASHELKTPLTTAKAYIQLLQLGMEKTKHEDLKYVKKAAASIERLNTLIDELLDVSKIQNGKINREIKAFNFNDMISGAIESVQYGSPNHEIIKTGEIEVEVKGDKERLKQVVINLLSNAVKYSPGADKVLIDVVQEDREVKVSIRDTGIGIRKENFAKIFERYYREEDRATHFQGLGIGLFISFEIIQRHNGNIWVQSEADKGSTFYFTVPI
jgi:two-component system, chemotaxis family, CheB/CheR fusion protein